MFRYFCVHRAAACYYQTSYIQAIEWYWMSMYVVFCWCFIVLFLYLYFKEFNVAEVWSKCDILQFAWKGDHLFTWRGDRLCWSSGGGQINNWHGEDQRSAFLCQHEVSIADHRPWRLKTMQPHYLRAKHGVATDSHKQLRYNT